MDANVSFRGRISYPSGIYTMIRRNRKGREDCEEKGQRSRGKTRPGI